MSPLARVSYKILVASVAASSEALTPTVFANSFPKPFSVEVFIRERAFKLPKESFSNKTSNVPAAKPPASAVEESVPLSVRSIAF